MSPNLPTDSCTPDSGLVRADQAARTYSAADAKEGTAAGCPRPRGAIEACVLGDDDRPLKDVAVELRKCASEVMRGRTNRQGSIRFEGLDAGGYQLGLYALDADAWELLETVVLAGDAARSDSQAEWTVPAEVGGRERTCVVEQGDSTAKIAERHGFFPDTVWDWPANAALKAARTDKNVLLPGDLLVIPRRRSKQVPAQVSRRYILRRKGIPEVLNLRFNVGGKPRSNMPYLASFEYSDGRVAADCAGVTSAGGGITLSVMPGIEAARITLGTGDVARVHVVKVGYLDPDSAMAGVQKRLANLGYYRGPLDGQPNDEFRDAVRSFQRDHRLEETGKPDGRTRQKILEMHVA